MTVWLIRRLLQAATILLLMTLIVFFGLHVIGNPIDILVAEDATQAERARMIASLGLDQPLWIQYCVFLANALQGDLGQSYVYNMPALPLILQRLPATFELAFAATGLAILIGIPLGLLAGLYPDRWFARMIMGGSIIGFSLPTFWVGLLLIMIFSVSLGWLPSTGRGETVSIMGYGWSFLTLDGWRHLLLPALNLALFKVALVLRLTRAGVREVLPQDYIRFARANGIAPKRIIGIHVLKNILIPLVTVIGLEFGSTIAFAVVTESIFAWPGAGKLIIDSINALDRPVIVAYLMIVVCLFVMINLCVDLLYRLLDPRVRLEASA